MTEAVKLEPILLRVGKAGRVQTGSMVSEMKLRFNFFEKDR